MKYKNRWANNPNFVYLGCYSTRINPLTNEYTTNWYDLDFYMLYNRSEPIEFISFGMRHSDEGSDYWSGNISMLQYNLKNPSWQHQLLSNFYDYLDMLLQEK